MQPSSSEPVGVKRRQLKLCPDATRVLLRPFIPKNAQQVSNVIGRAMSLTDAEVEQILAEVLAEFSNRHFNAEAIFERHFRKVSPHLFIDRALPRSRELLIGSLFTGEYALESAALFNPSIVPHPDQSDIPAGALRIIMSLRATGEGHISSIEFRSGVIDAANEITLDAVGRHVSAPDPNPDPTYDKPVFTVKLHDMGFRNLFSDGILDALPDTFTFRELQRIIDSRKRETRIRTHDEERTFECLSGWRRATTKSFPEKMPLGERIIFPHSANESNGIEDARFVRFVDDDGSAIYYATYTAYNGRVILPQLIETRDFLRFKIVTLNGNAVQNKGMALFPRRIRGQYAMLSRQDDENLFLMFSDNPHFWSDPVKLLRPAFSWELSKLGNCGSPIETPEGWLVITHGVGPMRKYCMGAVLLDLENPLRVIGRLAEPLIKPAENEREGYVPNVVYSCGSLAHNGEVIIPYAMSDFASSVATVSLDELLAALRRV